MADKSTREKPGKAAVILAGIEVGPKTHAIFLPKSPTPTEKTAAKELQCHLHLMTGKRLQILPETRRGERHGFFVGRCAAAKVSKGVLDGLGEEGLLIRSQGKDLCLVGNRRGVLYAVSVLLEDYLNCRWFAPDCTRVPKSGTIKLPKISRRQIPRIEVRDTNWPHGIPALFAMRNRLNGNNALLEEKHGGTIAYHPFVHTFDTLVPVAKYFDKHPEYFSLVGSARIKERTQLCLTNPEVLRISIERVRQWIKERPDARIYSVSQNDWRNPCECPKCSAIARKEGSEAGPLLHFVNAIADNIREDYPDKVIDTLAYQYTRRPPRHVRPRPNVTVRLCSIECCFMHPLDKCPVNRDFVEDLEGWGKICKHLSIWDYVINYNHCLAPFPDLYVIQPNIKLFVEHGITNIFEEGNYFTPGGEALELRTYLTAKALWDPDCDTDEVIDEFVQGYYGAAAPQMRAYVDLVHEGFRRGKGAHVRIWGWEPSAYMQSDFVPRAQALFRKALKAVEGDAVLTRRVRIARLPVLYMVLNGAEGYEERKGALVDPDLHDGGQWFDEFRSVAEDVGVSHFREQRDIEEWLESRSAHRRALPVERLSNGRVEIEIVPDFGGRVLRLRDVESGVNWTKVFRVGDRLRPGGSGIEDYSGVDYQSPGWSEPYKVVERGPMGMSMSTTLRNGFVMTRRVELVPDRPCVRVCSSLRKTTSKAGTWRLRVHPSLAAPDMKRARLLLMRGGKWCVQPAPQPKERDSWAAADLRGDARPEGAWGLLDDTTGRCIICRVIAGDVAIYYSSWNYLLGEITFELWTPFGKRARGAVQSIEYELELCREPPRCACRSGTKGGR